MSYILNLEAYQGPLDKLLELVEAQKLDINQISLAKVTADFFNYLEKMQRKGVPHSVLADFLVIASKLLLIKSKVLIPALELGEEEEENIQELELQLKLYKEIKDAKEHIKSKWSDLPKMASREFLMAKEVLFYPPQKIGVAQIVKAFETILKEIEKFKPVEHIKTEIINLRDKIKETLERITDSPINLKKLSKRGTKGELVVLFLAILHLLKEELIDVQQNNHFGDILIVKKSQK